MLNLKIKKFHELTKRFGSDIIAYDWDAGHCYSMLKSCYEKEIDNVGGHISSDEEDILMDIINEWMFQNVDMPSCVPDGGCGCCSLMDMKLGELHDFKHAWIMSGESKGSSEDMIRAFYTHYRYIQDRIDELELADIIDDQISARRA